MRTDLYSKLKIKGGEKITKPPLRSICLKLHKVAHALKDYNCKFWIVLTLGQFFVLTKT